MTFASTWNQRMIEQLRAENHRLRIAFERCRGALTDAGSVVVPDEPEQVETAIRELTKERDRLRAAVLEEIEDMKHQADVDELNGGPFNEGAAAAYRNCATDMSAALEQLKP